MKRRIDVVVTITSINILQLKQVYEYCCFYFPVRQKVEQIKQRYIPVRQISLIEVLFEK
jgi:hypothetical protein